MKKFEVTFTQYYTYCIEAEDEDKAIKCAEEEFEADMRYPVAYTAYDEVSVAQVDEEEEE